MLSGLFMFTALLFLAFAAGFGAHWLLTRASGTASDAPGSVTILTDAQRLLRDTFLGPPPAQTTPVYGPSLLPPCPCRPRVQCTSRCAPYL